jgi:hypothetical protein
MLFISLDFKGSYRELWGPQEVLTSDQVRFGIASEPGSRESQRERWEEEIGRNPGAETEQAGQGLPRWKKLRTLA